MRAVLGSLRDGFRSLRLNWGLVVVVLVTNLALAALVAVPLAFMLEAELEHKGAASAMMYGFDYDWWSSWSERQQGPEAALDRGQLRAALARAIDELPDAARETLILREVEGLSYAEIAEALEIPKGTVMSRLHYARRRVQELLRRAGVVEGEPAGTAEGDAT